MAGTVTFAGVGSGIDVESLISGLTAVAAQPISQEKSKAASLRAAQSKISDVGSLLSKLKLSVNALSTAQQASAFKASSTGTSLAVSATGAAQPGAYDVAVTKLAKEQRTYSNAFSANALGFSGNLELAVGAGTPKQIEITATDTLNSIADKINGAGLRVGASVFYDGTNYRLQVRGLDTGAANGVTFGGVGGIGDQLGLRTAANTKQAAQDAALTVDGFAITSATNQVSGAIPGVTIALKEENATSKVTVETDPTAMGDKLQAVVDAYNGVIKSIQSAAGTSKSPASNPALAGNSTLRGVASKLSSALLTTFGEGKFNLLGSVGVNLQNDGTLLLNRSKLATALEQDRAGVTALLGGTSTTAQGGVMAKLASVIEDVMDPTKGALEVAKTGFDTRAKSVEDGVAKAQQRLTVYADQLRKQFTAMDATVAGYQSALSSLSIKA